MKYLKPHTIILAIAFLAFAASIFVGEEPVNVDVGPAIIEVKYSHILQLTGFILGFVGFLLFSLRRRRAN